MKRGLILIAAVTAAALAFCSVPHVQGATGCLQPVSFLAAAPQERASEGEGKASALPTSDTRHPVPGTRYLYVPYLDLEAVLGEGTKGVFLSRAEYERLSAEAAAARRRLALAGKAPVQAAILSADYTGQVLEDRALIKAAFTLEVLGAGGAIIALPLDLRGVAIDSATLDGRPALLGGDRAGRLTLFVADAAPGRHALAMTLSARVVARDHDSILRLGLPPTPAAQVTLAFDGDLDVSASAPIVERTYDQAGNKTTVRLVPQGRSRQPPAVSDQRSEEVEPQPADLIVTFVSNNGRREREPLILSDVTALASVSDGAVSFEATCALTVLLKPADRFAITLPADLAVTEVSEANLLAWTVSRHTGLRQTVTVQLSEPQWQAVIRLAATGRPASLADWTFPRIATEGAAIERGVLALALSPEVRAQDEHLLHCRRFDGAAAQKPVSDTSIVREYAFWRQPYRCQVDIVPVVTETVAFNNLVLRLAQEELQLTTQVTFVPRAGRLYQARVRLPAVWDVIAVGTSRSANEYTWQEVKSPDGAWKDIAVTLKHRVAPREPFVVTIDARHAPADWPDRSWTERTVPLPDVRVQDAVEVLRTADSADPPERRNRAGANGAVPIGEPLRGVRGQLGVWADPEFRITPVDLTNLVPVDVRGLKELNGSHLALGFRFDQEPGGRLHVVRREPRIRVETVGCASLSERVLRSVWQLNYTVEHAGQDTFRFVVEGAPTGGKLVVRGVQPAAVGGIRPSAVAVKHWDRLADFAGPGEAWVVQTQRRQRGPVSLLVTFERELTEELGGSEDSTRLRASVSQPVSPGRDDDEPRKGPAGQVRPGHTDASGGATPQSAGRRPNFIAVPTVRCLDVEGQSGYLLVAGRDDTELTAEPSGLTEVDPFDAPVLSDHVPGRVVKAYRYLGLPIGLVLVPTRHPPAAVPEALITRADLTTVVERDGACRTRAVFRLAMARPSPVRVTLPAGAVVWTAQVNGRPIKPNLIDGGLAIPVEAVGAGAVEISVLYVHRVSLPAAGQLTLDPPVVAGLEVAETAWSVYLPEDLQYLAPAGTMQVVDPPIEPLAAAQALRAIGRWWEAIQPVGRVRAYARHLGRAAPSVGHHFGYGGEEAAPTPQDAPAAPAPAEDQGWYPEDENGLRRPDEEAPDRMRPEGSTLTLEVPLTTRGRVYRFHRLDGSGRAGIAYVPRRVYRFLTYAAFGVVVVLGLALGWARLRRRVQYVLVVLIAASVAPSLVGEGITTVANGAFWGGLVTAGWYLVHWLGRLAVRVIAWAGGNPAIEVGRASPRTAAMVVFLIAALAAGTVSAAAQPDKRLTPSRTRLGLPMGEGVRVRGPGHTTGDEETVIVPYDSAHPERARQSDRVYLPYERYVEMWNLAHPDRPLAWPVAPPVDAILGSAAYYGRLAVSQTRSPGDRESGPGRVAFQAEFGLHVFREGWTEVPLNLGGVAVREATLDDQPTTLAAVDGTYRLYVNAPGAYTLRVWFVAQATVLGETGRCAFTIPPVAAALLEIAVPSEDLVVTVANAVGGQRESRGPARTVVQAHLGPVGRVEFTWRPRARRVERETAVSATVVNLVRVTESAVRLTAAVRYELAGGGKTDTAGGRQHFALAVPADLEVEAIVGDNIRAWRVADSLEVSDPALKGRLALQMVLHRPTTTGLEVTVHGYLKTADRSAAAVVGAYDLPVVHTLEAGRETGQVGLAVDPALALVVAQTTGLQEIDTSEFGKSGDNTESNVSRPVRSVKTSSGRAVADSRKDPAGAETVPGTLDFAEGPPLRSAYRYARRPVSIRAAVTRRAPEVTAAVFTALRIRKEETTFRSVIDLEVRNLGIHHLRMRLPANVANVGVAAGDAHGDLLENWHLVQEPRGAVLTVNLSRGVLTHGMPGGTALSKGTTPETAAPAPVCEPLRGALGSARVTLTGDLAKSGDSMPAARPEADDNRSMRSPDFALALPQVTVLDAPRQSGRVAVSVAAGLEVSPADIKGLTAVDAATLADHVALEQDERLVLGFRYDAAGYSADLAVRFLEPRVTAETVSHVLIADTFVAYRFAVGYLVENAGVRAFRFSLPAWMGEAVEVTGEHIRQVTSAPDGDGPQACRVWTVTLQGEVMGAYRLFVYHEAPAPDGGRMSLPRIDVLDVARSRNYVAVQNTSRLEVLAQGIPGGTALSKATAPETAAPAPAGEPLRGVQPKQAAVAEAIAPAELPILPQGTRSADILGAWRCINGLWAIDLDLVAHEGQEVQRDTVELMDVITVVERDGHARSRITYRLANRRRQFLELALPEGWRLWGAQVGRSSPNSGPLGTGNPVRPATAVRQGRPLVLIPLIKTAPSDLNYDAVVVCEGPIGGSFKSSISTVTPEVVSMPVVRTVMTLYLPPGFHYFNDRGNLERTVGSERAYQQTVTLLAEQDRLQRLAKHAAGPISWEAWSNYRRNREVLASQMEATRLSNLAAVEETSGLLANPKERARAQELQKKMAEAERQWSQLLSHEADLRDQLAPQAQVTDAVSMVRDLRSNAWSFNDAVDPTSRRLWRGEGGDDTGKAREGQVGRRYGRWLDKTQQDGGWTDQPAGPQAQPRALRGVGGQVVRLGNVSPEQAEAVLRQLLTDQTPDGARGAGLNRKQSDVTIQADTDNNALIIQGDPETVQAVEMLLKQLDTASAGAAMQEVHIIVLKHADAAEVARTVNGLFHTRAGRKGGPAGEGRAVASFDPRTNSLVVSASKEDRRAIEELVAGLDQAEGATRSTISPVLLPPSPPTAEVPVTASDDLAMAAMFMAGDRDDRRVPGGAASAEGEGGLLSLAIDIPKVGTRLDFVKTQGDPRLTISVLDAGLVRKVSGLAVGLVLLFLALAVTDWRRTVRFLRALSVFVPMALVAVGGWSIVTGMHRPIGIGAAAAGVLLLAWAVAAMRRRSRRAAALA